MRGEALRSDECQFSFLNLLIDRPRGEAVVAKVAISTEAGKKRQLKVRARPFRGDLDGGSAVHKLLTPSEQHELERIATVLEYRAANTTIYSEDEDAHFVYVIDKGIIRITRHSEQGDRQVMAFLWPGDLFGLSDRGHYVNTAETLTPATLLRFPLQRLQSLLLRETQLQLHLLVKAANVLRETQHQIIVLGRQDSLSRVASFLLDLSHHVAFHDNAPTNLRLPMSRVDIADYLGISSETVTRALSKLEDDGLITRFSPRALRIDDLVGLTNLAHGRRSH